MTKTMRDYLINGIITTVGSVVVALTVSFYVFKRDNNVLLEKEVETLKLQKLDKTEFKEHVLQQKVDRENDNAAVIEAIEAQGKATREWIDLAFKKNK